MEYKIDLNTKNLEKAISEKTNTKRDIGVFKNKQGNSIRLTMTPSQIMKRWMELRDKTLLPTFKATMHWTDEMIEAVEYSIRPDEKEVANWLLTEFYPCHIEGKYDDNPLDEIYEKVYKFRPTSFLHSKSATYRTLRKINYSYTEEEGLNQSGETVPTDLVNAFGRIGYKKTGALKNPLVLIGAYESTQKYIIEMENFKAFSSLRISMSSIYRDDTVKQAIQQYHGNEVLDLSDRFLDSFHRSGAIESQRYQNECLLCKAS